MSETNISDQDNIYQLAITKGKKRLIQQQFWQINSVAIKGVLQKILPSSQKVFFCFSNVVAGSFMLLMMAHG